MTLPENLASLSHDALLAVVAKQHHPIAVLTAPINALQAEIERLTRGAKRQAAPWAKRTRVATPKRPGRQPGAGPFCYREPSLPTQITEPPVDIPVTLAACPACGGPLEEERLDGAYTTDIPARPHPTVTQARVSVCRCLVCGKPVRGQHPDVAPDQYGAPAPRVGDRTMAAAPGLHYGIGRPVRKGPLGLEALPGLTRTQGAITQEALRRATGEIGAA